MAKLKSIASKRKINYEPIGSDGSENVDTLEGSMQEFESNTDALFEMDRDVAGGNMFGFRTPKKRNALATLVANTPKTPKTPTSTLRALSLNSPRTPRSNRKEIAQISTKTPHHERNQLKKEMKKRLAEESEDEWKVSDDDEQDPNYTDSESDNESDSDSSASETDGARARPTISRNQMLKNVRVTNKPIEIVSNRSARLQRRNQLADPEFLPQSDNYFSAASTKKVNANRRNQLSFHQLISISLHFAQVKTSDHTLDKLKSSALQYDDIFAMLRKIELSDEHRIATSEMVQEHSQNFASWMLQLSKGFNIIIYGVGSKQCVLQQFCETYPDRPYIIVNGFFPTMTVKDILNAIRTDILSISTNTRTDHEIVDGIAVAFKRSPKTHLFLVIHNIDGPMLRKIKDQHILSRLAKIPNIHLLASVDHINAPLMWDQTCLSNYNFVWYDCTTMLPYTNETAFENSMFLRNSGELNLAAMNNVFQSLTTNARGIYMLLIESHMKNRKDAIYQGNGIYRCKIEYYILQLNKK